MRQSHDFPYLPVLTLTFLLFLSFNVADCAFHYVKPPAGYVVKRDDDIPIRGWALAIADTCPDGTGRCGKASCCPYGSYCDDTADTNSNFCCPSSLGCGFQLALDSRCADVTWTLWSTNKDPICCLAGQQGTQPASDEYYGRCVPGLSAVAQSNLATKIGSGPTAWIPIPSQFCGSTAPAPTVTIKKRAEATVAVYRKF